MNLLGILDELLKVGDEKSIPELERESYEDQKSDRKMYIDSVDKVTTQRNVNINIRSGEIGIVRCMKSNDH